jgi:hypothetical protein
VRTVPARNEYREKADDCLLQAELICDSRDRAALLALAQFYMKLADRIGQRHERGTAHRSRGHERGQNDS